MTIFRINELSLRSGALCSVNEIIPPFVYSVEL